MGAAIVDQLIMAEIFNFAILGQQFKQLLDS